jgi:hypothetical protein
MKPSGRARVVDSTDKYWDKWWAQRHAMELELCACGCGARLMGSRGVRRRFQDSQHRERARKRK